MVSDEPQQFEHIVEQARSRVQGWSERKTSCAGKEVHLKSVIQALPAYSMSCFKLTKGLCRKVTTVMSKYWWAGSLDRRGMHWQSWEKMAIPRSKGGLGFRELELFNDAMLGKQAWRLLVNPESLCARVLRGRYYHDGNFLEAGCPNSASATWRAIIQGREVLKQGLIRRVGDGRTTEVWHDQWIKGTATMKPICRLTEDPVHLVVDLVDENSGEWNVELIRKMFIAPDAEAIINMPLPRVAADDFWAWEWERSGSYSVRSAYRVLKEKQCNNQPGPSTSSGGEETWKALWKLHVQPKIRVFWWRVLKGFLPTDGELCRRHVRDDAICPMCGHSEETLFHALVSCEHALLFWEEAQNFFAVKIPKLHPLAWTRDLLDPNFIRMWPLQLLQSCGRYGVAETSTLMKRLSISLIAQWSWLLS